MFPFWLNPDRFPPSSLTTSLLVQVGFSVISVGAVGFVLVVLKKRKLAAGKAELFELEEVKSESLLPRLEELYSKEGAVICWRVSPFVYFQPFEPY